MLGKSRAAQGRLAHGIERIRDNDEDRVRRALDALIDYFADDVRVRLQKIVAAHSGFARQAGGDDDYVGICRLVITVSAGQADIKTFDRCGFSQIQSLALRYALDDIYKDDIP